MSVDIIIDRMLFHVHVTNIYYGDDLSYPFPRLIFQSLSINVTTLHSFFNSICLLLCAENKFSEKNYIIPRKSRITIY